MKIMNLKIISRVNLLLLGAAVLLAALAIAMTATGAWSRLRSWAPFLDKAQTALLTQVATWPPSNNTFYMQSYGGKCLTFSAPARGLALGGGRVFISDCNRTASQRIRVEELTDRPGHLVVLHAGAGVIGKQAYQVFSGPPLLSAQSSISSEAQVQIGAQSSISSEAQVQLEVQSYTGSAGQIFALDGDSIILAEDRNLVVEVQNNRGANGTPLVLGRRDLADSEFWTFSATDDSNRKPTSGFARVPDDRDHRPVADQFVSAVQQAKPGAVIEVLADSDTPINLKGYPTLQIPAGVTIRGDRRFTSLGPELWAPYDAEATMFEIAGDDVRITGLRMRGPTRSTDEGSPETSAILAHDTYKTIIDHNDLSDWTVSAINITGDDVRDHRDPHSRPQNVRVTRNFIHHNQMAGLGYGVVTGDNGYPLIEGNTFVANRHAIADDGTEFSGYRALYNLVLFQAPGYGLTNHVEQDFDMHGLLDTCGQHCGGIAGEYVEIARNTFLGGNRINFRLRGTPTTQSEFINNVLVGNRDDAIKNSGDAWKLTISGNQFEAHNPTNRLGVGDFDGDGRQDLFLATGAAWYYAPAGVAEWRYLSAQTEKMDSLLFGDFDGDGRTDVFTMHGRDWVVSWGGASNWEMINQSDPRMSDFAIGDFNGDHRADVFYADGQAWYVSYGGVGAFELFDTSSFRVADLRFGDFNGDGKTDVFGVVNGAWSVTYGGTVNWSPLRSRLTNSVAGLIVADFNGDGRADIARSDCSFFGGCDWQVSYSGVGDWRTLRSDSGSLASAAAIGRFDGNKSADVLLWRDNYLEIASGGSGTRRRQSRQDMR